MANLTKTQINYFSERLSAGTRKMLAIVEEKMKAEAPREMTSVEKVHLIASGKAVFKFDEVMRKAQSGYGIGELNSAFEFPGDCEATTAAKEYDQKWKRFTSYVWSVRDIWVDEFVMGAVEEPDKFVQNIVNRADEFYQLFKEGKF